MKNLTLFNLLVILTLMLAACAPAVTPVPTTIPAPTNTTSPITTAAPTAPTAPTATAAPTATKVPDTIVDVFVADGRFKTLAAALTAAGLVDTLKGAGPFTVFAPTDTAFAKLPAGTVETLLKPENKAKLAAILLYHVVPGKLAAAQVTKLKQATTLDGPGITFKVSGDKIAVNNANVVTADVAASNGVIHVIDSVILPPDTNAPTQDIVSTLVGSGFTTLALALGRQNLFDTLHGAGPFTIFAPTDSAFKALPAEIVDNLVEPGNQQKLIDILTYHMVGGALSPLDLYTKPEAATVEGENVKFSFKDGAFFINDAQVVLAALPATNGVIYVINAVILPQKYAAAPVATKDIFDTIMEDSRFRTLVTALDHTDLLYTTLKGKGPLTFFAPTNEAFAKLPSGMVAGLPRLQMMTDILPYHVVASKYLAADLVTMTRARTVEGNEVTIRGQDGKIYIDDAQVIVTDILATNGVIHVIDSVLRPPEAHAAPAATKDIFDTLMADGRFNSLVQFLMMDPSVMETLRGEGPFTVFAPTNGAFDKQPGTVADTDILNYHMVAGKLLAADLVKMTSARTVEGKDVTITVQNDIINIGRAQVIVTDILTTNGVIHLIDSVLRPPEGPPLPRPRPLISSTPPSPMAALRPWSPHSKLPTWSIPSKALAPSPSSPPPTPLLPNCPQAPSTPCSSPRTNRN